jgi:2,3-dihydroxybenzoate-AMP ligase
VVNVFCFGAWTGVGYKAAACAWLAGATVVIDQRTAWYEALLYPDVTHATVIPEVLASILAAPDGAFPKSENMRLMITGGTVTQAQIDQAKARITPHLYNSLSSTEVSIFGFTALDSPEDHRWHRPVSGREMQIVDEFDRLMPIGEVGLVRVSTAGGPTHYLDDEEATRAFFKDGFFYPGDLGVIRPDGRFALQGRVTDVINMNGHKISPAPIEDNLREALGVSGVCLFSMQDDHGEEEVHVVIEARTPIDAERLGATLRRELTGFPRACVRYVTALPRNSMGKVLRAAVRTQSRSASLTPEDAGLG